MSAPALAESPSGLTDTEGLPITDWPTIRDWVLRRARAQCEICGVRGATDADHIWPRRLGGDDHVDNLQAACGPCNKSKGSRVDLTDAKPWQLLLAVDALRQRITDMEREQATFENELLVRSAMDGELPSAAETFLLSLHVRHATIGYQISRWERALRRIAAKEAASAVDSTASVTELRREGGAA
jgi:hypothetical protein